MLIDLPGMGPKKQPSLAGAKDKKRRMKKYKKHGRCKPCKPLGKLHLL